MFTIHMLNLRQIMLPVNLNAMRKTAKHVVGQHGNTNPQVGSTDRPHKTGTWKLVSNQGRYQGNFSFLEGAHSSLSLYLSTLLVICFPRHLISSAGSLKIQPYKDHQANSTSLSWTSHLWIFRILEIGRWSAHINDSTYTTDAGQLILQFFPSRWPCVAHSIVTSAQNNKK